VAATLRLPWPRSCGQEDADVENAICASFVENVGPWDRRCAGLHRHVAGRPTG